MIGFDIEPKLRIRITRNYKGDTFMYIVEFDKHGERTCKVRLMCTDIEVNGIVDEDNKHINLFGNFTIKGINGENPKLINRLKIPPAYLHHIKDQLDVS